MFFGLCAVAGALILVGSVLPAFELYLNASTGTGGCTAVPRVFGRTVLAISLVVWFRASLLTVPRPWLAVPLFLAVVVLIALATVAWSLRNYE